VLRYKVIASSGTVLYDAPNKESWVTSKGFRLTIPGEVLVELWNHGGGSRIQQVYATIRYETAMDAEEEEFSFPIQLSPDEGQAGSESKFVVKSIG
jgi:hypothetical protein